jgi:hypothetical protein
MRIVRYELEIVDYQQIQPLWPGKILAVKPGRLLHPFYPEQRTIEDQKIDMWCLDDIDNTPGTPTILGVWIVGTGNPMPEAVVNPAHGKLGAGIEFEDTCVMANGLVWHVFTAVGFVPAVETDYGEVSSVDDIANKVADRRRDELQRIADIPRENQGDVRCICEQEAPGIVIWNENCPRHAGAPYA